MDISVLLSQLTMTESSHHSAARWLVHILEAVLLRSLTQCTICIWMFQWITLSTVLEYGHAPIARRIACFARQGAHNNSGMIATAQQNISKCPLHSSEDSVANKLVSGVSSTGRSQHNKQYFRCRGAKNVDWGEQRDNYLSLTANWAIISENWCNIVRRFVWSYCNSYRRRRAYWR